MSAGEAETKRQKRKKRGAAPEPLVLVPAWEPRSDLPRPLLRYAIGCALVLGGAAAVLYPAVHDAAGYQAVRAAWGDAPLYGVVAILLGAAVLVWAVHVASGEPRPWAPDANAGGGLAHKLEDLKIWRVFREIDLEALADRQAWRAKHPTGYDWRPLIAFGLGAVFLALMEYFGHKPHMLALLASWHPPHEGGPDHWIDDLRASAFLTGWGPTGLIGFAWWSLARVMGFFVLPALVIKVLFRDRIVDYGLQTRGFFAHAWIYAGAFVVVLVLVVTVSYDEHFQTYYPFYDWASRSWYDFWAWELLYAAQFFSLEFFFRGFLLNAAKRAMGSHAIIAMTVPYVMIHFGKPFPETLAAILAGIALGALSLRTRSIWSGFLIHVSVAISMDIAALLQTDGLPSTLWPEL